MPIRIISVLVLLIAIGFMLAVAGKRLEAPTVPTVEDSVQAYVADTFSIAYPDAASLIEGDTAAWSMLSTATGTVLVRMRVPDTVQPGTNFRDATLTVGTSDDTLACYSSEYATVTEATISGVPFTRLSQSNAGAGNRYETVSYRTVREGLCYAVEYTIHTTVLENYDPAQGITAYDRTRIESSLESAVRSFRFR